MSQGDLKERNMGPNIFGCCAVGHGKMVLQVGSSTASKRK